MRIRVFYRIKEKVGNLTSLGDESYVDVEIQSEDAGHGKYLAKEEVQKKFQEKGINIEVVNFIVFNEC